MAELPSCKQGLLDAELNYYDRRNQFRRRIVMRGSVSTNCEEGSGISGGIYPRKELTKGTQDIQNELSHQMLVD